MNTETIDSDTGIFCARVNGSHIKVRKGSPVSLANISIARSGFFYLRRQSCAVCAGEMFNDTVVSYVSGSAVVVNDSMDVSASCKANMNVADDAVRAQNCPGLLEGDYPGPQFLQNSSEITDITHGTKCPGFCRDKHVDWLDDNLADGFIEY